MSSNQVHHSSYPRIEFTQDVYEKHLGNMERIAALALAGRSGWDKATATPAHGWSRLTDSAGWQVLSLQAPSPGVHEYLCFGTLRTSLVALQHAFYVKNTYEFRALSAVMYEDTIADAALLNITHRQTAADVGQFFGVKYLKLLVQVLNEEDQEQEYVYLEFSGTRVDALGRRTWFVVTEPVAIKSASDSDPSSSISSSGNSRGSHASEPFHKSISFGERCSCVKLYRETYDGCVEVTVRTKLEAGGGNPEANPKLHGSAAALARKAGQLVFWKSMGVFIPSGLAKDLLSLCRTGCVPESVRLTTGSFAPSWEHGNKCKVCFKFFNLLRRKHHCRRCGSSMCGACTVALHCVDRPTKSRTSEAVAVEKFCKSCLVQAKIDTMRVDGDAGRGGGRRRGGSDDGTTHSAVMSGSNKRVAHLHSPTRNANGDHFFLNELQSVYSSSDFVPPVDQVPPPPAMILGGALKLHRQTSSTITMSTSSRYTPAISTMSTDFSEFDLSVHRHAPDKAAAASTIMRGSNQQRHGHEANQPRPPFPNQADATSGWDLLRSKFEMVKLADEADRTRSGSDHFEHLFQQATTESTSEHPHRRYSSRAPPSNQQQRY